MVVLLVSNDYYDVYPTSLFQALVHFSTETSIERNSSEMEMIMSNCDNTLTIAYDQERRLSQSTK